LLGESNFGAIIVNVFVCLLAAISAILLWLLLSSSRSRYEAGRRRGVEEAVRELQRGLQSVLDPQSPTPEIAKAEKDLLVTLRQWSPRRFGTDPLHAQVWVLGAALGDACWVKGHAAGVRRKAPAEGKIRIDLPLVDLLQLGGLANLGFQHMMPNAKLLQIRRFVGEDDALEATRAITKIEGAIPREHRPDLLRQAASREQLIADWWRPISGKSVA
jgi:hypothetical protein